MLKSTNSKLQRIYEHRNAEEVMGRKVYELETTKNLRGFYQVLKGSTGFLWKSQEPLTDFIPKATGERSTPRCPLQVLRGRVYERLASY